MSRINTPGQHIKLPDGREATTVFNGLTGVGIKWGIHNVSYEDFEDTDGGCFAKPVEESEWSPDAMLRDPSLTKTLEIECVGEEYEFIGDAL